MIDLFFDPRRAEGYRSRAQVARVLTEDWFARVMYCVACGNQSLERQPNNTRATDFCCQRCDAAFELKSASRPFGGSVVDGAYATMMQRLQQGGGPHLALLHYAPQASSVRDLVLIPGSLLTPDVIRRRPPLGPRARRSGWVGCNIAIGDLPPSGRIAVVRDGLAHPPSTVVRDWQRLCALHDPSLAERSWRVDVLRCVERLGRGEFTLADAYGFEAELAARHPGNLNVRPKIRQQLQRLRDAGLVTFLGKGRYRFHGSLNRH